MRSESFFSIPRSDHIPFDPDFRHSTAETARIVSGMRIEADTKSTILHFLNIGLPLDVYIGKRLRTYVPTCVLAKEEPHIWSRLFESFPDIPRDDVLRELFARLDKLEHRIIQLGLPHVIDVETFRSRTGGEDDLGKVLTTWAGVFAPENVEDERPWPYGMSKFE